MFVWCPPPLFVCLSVFLLWMGVGEVSLIPGSQLCSSCTPANNQPHPTCSSAFHHLHRVNVFSNHSSPQCSFYLSNNTKLELNCSKSVLIFLITKLSPFFLLQEHHPAARQSASPSDYLSFLHSYPTKTSFNLLYTLLRSLISKNYLVLPCTWVPPLQSWL